jgi:hypothetical protein
VVFLALQFFLCGNTSRIFKSQGKVTVFPFVTEYTSGLISAITESVLQMLAVSEEQLFQ